MLLVVERRVPERHDGVAHIFVDGALAREDRVGQRRQETVHQRGQALRIVLEGFRDGGEAADVGEHDGHLALLAAEHELFRRLRELLDQRRRQILAERRADLPPLRLLAHEAGEDQRQIDRRGRQQRIGEIDQQPVLRVEIPGGSDQHRREQRADRDQRDRPELRRERDHQDSEQQRASRIRAAGRKAAAPAAIWSTPPPAPGHGFRRPASPRHRRGLDVVEPDRRGSDQHQLALDLFRRDACPRARRAPET